MLVATIGCGDEDSRSQDPHGRSIVATEWDTIQAFGPLDANDSTLLVPDFLVAWGDRVAVIDRSPPLVSVFSRAGELLWRYSSQGPGPGEIQWITDATVTPRGTLWVLDNRNTKVLELDSAGRLQRELPTHHFPVAPSTLTVLEGGRVVLSTQNPETGLILAEADSLEVLDARRAPWADSIT
ncbi:MAG TPA: 6-bladed beta-propeller, partial [Longimicrobiales bacterium]|nr:6-bladed beta-propeller [Longimicrobiales bacterium]